MNHTYDTVKKLREQHANIVRTLHQNHTEAIKQFRIQEVNLKKEIEKLEARYVEMEKAKRELELDVLAWTKISQDAQVVSQQAQNDAKRLANELANLKARDEQRVETVTGPDRTLRLLNLLIKFLMPRDLFHY